MQEYMSTDKLRRHVQAGQAPTVIDVRGADEYSAGHLPGALNVPADQLGERLAEIRTDRPVVTY